MMRTSLCRSRIDLPPLLSVLFILASYAMTPGCSDVSGDALRLSRADSSAVERSPSAERLRTAAILLQTGQAARPNDVDIRSQQVKILPRGSSALGPALATIDLGVAKPREIFRDMIVVENCRPEAVRIDYVTSSCECARFDKVPLTIRPSERVALPFELDLGKEPDFHGGLGVVATLHSNSQDLVSLELRVNVERDGTSK
jgi:hypothetical protein